ncbi:hypothetical protein JOC36_000545 [Weissella uvarum]|uniref:type II toxin-antitoxin system PemK/MazF family toxin n=1 Tax=Weissella uvarum TaxID=1479233 RepID=UPI0030B838DE|nr:hypothetical protein [Weissella uvarum]
MAWVVPISHGRYDGQEYPLHVALDDRTKIDGTIYTEQLKAFDFQARDWQLVEELPQDILDELLHKVTLAVSH